MKTGLGAGATPNLKNLCQFVLTRLENEKAIVFASKQRAELTQALADVAAPFIWTSHDLRLKALEAIGRLAAYNEKNDTGLEQSSNPIEEDEQFKTSFSIVRTKFGNEQIAGFYYQKSAHDVALLFIAFLLKSPLVEEVFETDAELLRLILKALKGFGGSSQRGTQ